MTMKYTPLSPESYEIMWDWTMQTMRELCVKYGNIPLGVAFNSRRKTKPLPQLRLDFTARSRLHVGYMGDGKWSRTIKLFDDGVEPPYKPASFPMVAGWLGVTHTALVHAITKSQAKAKAKSACEMQITGNVDEITLDNDAPGVNIDAGRARETT